MNPKSFIDHDCEETPENNDFNSDSADSDDAEDDVVSENGNENDKKTIKHTI